MNRNVKNFEQVEWFDKFEKISATPSSSYVPTRFVRYWEIGEYAALLQQLDFFISAVLETDQIPFNIRYQSGHQQAVRNPGEATGHRSLSGFLPLCGQFMDLYFLGYSYSADLQLFFDCFRQHPFARVFGWGEQGWNLDKAFAAELYNDFVHSMRREAARRGVRKWLSDWRGNAWDQATSIREYLQGLQAHYRLLLPVRLDLYYAEYATCEGDARERTGWALSDNGSWMSVPSTASVGHDCAETRARIDTAVAMADRDHFFGNRQGADREIFDSMVGYVCKLEQGGKQRANHFHCIFLYDARRVSQADLARLIYRAAERWRSVTRGQGLIYNCHERPDRAELAARGLWALAPMGSAHPEQTEKLVNYVVRYFAKEDDQVIRVKPTTRARTLTMGQLPRTP